MMDHFRSTLCGVALLCASTLANAQDQAGASQEPAPVVEAPSPDNALSSQRFDDWHYRCVNAAAEDGKSTPQCEVVQVARVKRGEEEVSLLTVAIAKAAPEGGNKASSDLLLTALVPLNVLLPKAFSLEADDKPVFTASYRNCNQAGCWVQQTLDPKMLAALRKGNAGTARLSLLNGQNVNIRFSLKGLTAALAALNASTAAK